ncbi:MAG TPA: F0F1 ATP synthase subunit B [Candidatus Saccharimonadales bacterium]|nr:F0F1 ATP synthase subunit B [Candidatus Saccharimonadales bacterium]
MHILLAQFGDSTSGLGALGLDLKALIIQLVSFVLAFWVLQHWAFKPIVKMMERRRETIEKGVNLGEAMQKEKAEFEKKVAKALADARQEADTVVSDAHSQAREAIHDAEEKARAKAEIIINEAQQRIEQDTKRARQQLEKELAQLITEATEAVVEEKLDASKDAALIDKALKERAGA